jgi:hypothetical protein
MLAEGRASYYDVATCRKRLSAAQRTGDEQSAVKQANRIEHAAKTSCFEVQRHLLWDLLLQEQALGISTANWSAIRSK